jgi:hypothetical protein
MKYTPSALVSEFSGAQGSTVASHNRFGPYLRNRTIPVDPNSAGQQTYRTILKTASAAWRSLTDVQRAAWAATAATIIRVDSLGRNYYMTGHQFFVSTCQAIRLYDVLAAYPTIPSSVIAPADLTSYTPTPAAGAGTFGLAFAVTPVPALTKYVVECTPQMSAGTNFIGRSRLRIVTLIPPASASPLALAASYVAKFGALVAGKKIALRLYAISSSGGRSNKSAQTVIVAA